MAAKVWKWHELDAFLAEFGLTLNGFGEAVGIRQSTLNNLNNGKTKTPREDITERVESGMKRFSHCPHCKTTLMDGEPYAKPASQTRRRPRAAS